MNILQRIAQWFRPQLRATQNDPNWEGWWHNQYGGKSSSGISVTRDNALMVPAVWQAVSMISGDVAKLPLDLYRKKGGDGEDREIYESHPAEWVVRWESNIEMTAPQFWRQMTADALIWNNSYAWIRRGGDGRPVELVPLLPDRTGPERAKDTGQLIYTTEVDKGIRVFDPYDILHIRGLMLCNGDGTAPRFLSYAREAIGLALSAQKFQSKFFSNGMRAFGVLQVPTGMPKQAHDNLVKSFREEYEGEDNWFRTVILKEGAKFQSIAQSNEQGQTHLLREDQVREVARLFNLPPSKLGLSDSVSYNSKSEDNQAYHDTTLSPWLTAIADECRFKLLLPGERFSIKYYFEHNTASLLRLNLLARYQAYEIAVNPNRGGFLLRSEVRKRENLPAIAEIDDPPEPAAPPPAQSGDQDPPDDSEPMMEQNSKAPSRETLEHEARLSGEWQTCRDSNAGSKAEFAHRCGYSLKEFEKLLTRVRMRRSRNGNGHPEPITASR